MPNLRTKTWTSTTPANTEDAQFWEDHLISDNDVDMIHSSVQSVNSITPDVNGDVDLGPIGHTIEDDDGTSMTQQPTMQFVNAEVTNDSVNSKTVVDCKGSKGDKGDAATIAVGTVTTLPAGSSATVTNAGTSSAAVFNFGIPQGQDGTGAVNSVNGQVGAVVLDATDINLDVPISMLSGTMLTVETALHGLNTDKQDKFSTSTGLKLSAANQLSLELLAGENIVLTSTSGAIEISSDGGGMLPYLYITSESGATVSVTDPNSQTITPIGTGTGQWECELASGYGTYVVHSTLGGVDATASVVVDTVKEYHVTDNHYDYTINLTAPSGASVSISDGTETVTGTGSGSYVVHNASSTYTISVSIGGNTKTDTVTSSSTSGQSTSVTIEFGTITVNVDAAFVTAGSSITCVSGGTSCTAQAAASTLIFRVPTTGTWTISGEISGTTYTIDAEVTSLSTTETVSLQTMPILSIPMYGAAGATITWTNTDSSSGTITLDNNGTNTATIKVLPSGSTITFTDTTVAKDTDDLTSNYSKQITLTNTSSSVYVMPDNVLYWYGYDPGKMEQASTANGWHSNFYGNNPPTFNTNDAVIGTSQCAWGTKDVISGHIYATIKGIVASTGSQPLYGYGGHTSAKGTYMSTYDNFYTSAGYNSTSYKKYDGGTITNQYFVLWAAGRSFSTNAVWYE